MAESRANVACLRGACRTDDGYGRMRQLSRGREWKSMSDSARVGEADKAQSRRGFSLLAWRCSVRLSPQSVGTSATCTARGSSFSSAPRPFLWPNPTPHWEEVGRFKGLPGLLRRASYTTDLLHVLSLLQWWAWEIGS